MDVLRVWDGERVLEIEKEREKEEFTLGEWLKVVVVVGVYEGVEVGLWELVRDDDLVRV